MNKYFRFCWKTLTQPLYIGSDEYKFMSAHDWAASLPKSKRKGAFLKLYKIDVVLRQVVIDSSHFR